MHLPRLALSIRQPWAYAIATGWKDIENRGWRRPNPGLQFRGPVAIHASGGMTRDEYDAAAGFIRRNGHTCPPAHQLVRGAIIGSAEIVDIVRQSDSPWFFGCVGLVIANAHLLDQPIPSSGSLGFFEWRPGGAIAAAAKWMLPAPVTGPPDPAPQLFTWRGRGNCGGYDG